ncbi:transposase [Streptomyces sp. NBC_01617]|uniref:transposase n=1 Tax=unclassified Streptomyces TaxID=2593676 RepID=UPI00386D9D3C
MNLPPQTTLSKLVNSLKDVSSLSLRQEYPELVRHYRQAQRLWPGSYFAGSVGGAQLSTVRQYIEQQNRPLQPAGQSTSQNRLTTGLKPAALLIPVAHGSALEDGENSIFRPPARPALLRSRTPRSRSSLIPARMSSGPPRPSLCALRPGRAADRPLPD